MDPEVLEFVKKEVGVGNVDPIKAQLRESLINQINKYRNQLEKLEVHLQFL